MSPLPAAARLRNHRGVGHATLLKGWLSALCLALMLVFATASAASVVDRFQHERELPHEHGLHLAGTHDHGDHHHGDSDDAPDADDHGPGAGHHHSDAPAGALDRPAQAAESMAEATLALRSASAQRIKGVRPGGLERPPRTV